MRVEVGFFFFGSSGVGFRYFVMGFGSRVFFWVGGGGRGGRGGFRRFVVIGGNFWFWKGIKRRVFKVFGLVGMAVLVVVFGVFFLWFLF